MLSRVFRIWPPDKPFHQLCFLCVCAYGWLCFIYACLEMERDIRWWYISDGCCRTYAQQTSKASPSVRAKWDWTWNFIADQLKRLLGSVGSKKKIIILYWKLEQGKKDGSQERRNLLTYYNVSCMFCHCNCVHAMEWYWSVCLSCLQSAPPQDRDLRPEEMEGTVILEHLIQNPPSLSTVFSLNSLPFKPQTFCLTVKNCALL